MHYHSLAPLSHERLAILLALAAGPATAAEIETQAIADSAGHVVLKRASLFRHLQELAARNLIESCSPQTYCLTDKGWARVKLEAQRSEQWAETATERHRLRL